MDISVTKDDINKGVRRETYHCPIALAVRRKFKDALSVRVDACFWRDKYCVSIVINTKKGFKSYRAGDKAFNFIRAFDVGKKVSPIRLRLDRSRYNKSGKL
jgi:hypothetical protein